MANKAHTPQSSLFRDVVLGGVATCCAVTFTNPLEVVKIRLQLQGELMRRGQFTKSYNGVVHAFTVILRNEGVLALQKGLLTAYMYQMIMNGTRLGSYDTLKRIVRDHSDGLDKNVFVNIACGATAGVAGAFVGSPLFLVKTRLQSSGGLVGQQYKYTGIFSALTSIAREGGILGLWRGALASMMRTGVGSSVQLPSYDLIRRQIVNRDILEEGLASQTVASVCAGFIVATVMNPFDVVSTRLYNQNADQPLYRGPFDCFRKILATEGVAGLLKGWTPHFMRIGPHTILTFFFWEQIKAAAVVYWPVQ